MFRSTSMRESYHDSLDAVTDQLVVMTRTVASMIERASAALLECDLAKAESVIALDEEVDAFEAELELRCTDLLALQQPVATDLRLVTGALRMSATIERMGDLARHIAKIARMRYPDSAVPDSLRPIFVDMAKQVSAMGQRVGDVIADKDLSLAYEIERLDDGVDDLHRQLLQSLLGGWDGTVEEAVDVTLMARFYERYADHAVSLARRIVYTTTGTRYNELEKG
jgi:phosphate transport system protein